MPGMDGTGRLFEPLVRAIGDNANVQVLSYPQDSANDYESLTDFVVDALPDKEPFILVAESFSGPLALLASAHKPNGLQAIVLCATFIRNPVPFGGPWMTPFMNPIWFKWTPMALMSHVLLGANPDQRLKAALIESLHEASPTVLTARSKAVLTVDASQALRDSSVPILYLRAQRDRVVLKGSLHDILSIRPDVTTVEIDGPHLLLQTRPELCRDVIDTFLRKGFNV